MKAVFRALVLIFSFCMFGFQANASSSEEHKESGKFDPVPVIMHHIADSHEFHIVGEGENSVTMPLPIILFTDGGLVTFMSSEFHHDVDGKTIVEKNGMRFVNVHDKIYQLNAGASTVAFDAEHHPSNAVAPMDFSITKNVFSMLMSVLIILLIFIPVAKKYKKSNGVPSGLQSFIEPLVVFVRDDVIVPNIGAKKADKFLPYLLTVFFFIWINNLIGLIPVFPFSSNLTGNIAFTMVMAVCTLVVTNVNGNKDYWVHIFNTPGVPWWLKYPLPLMPLVEFVGVLAKPFALMVRLFANITAGHIIILSLVSLIFIFETVAVSAVSVPFVLFMNVLELLVAFLQAYIFTMLTALFIGSAVAEHEHH